MLDGNGTVRHVALNQGIFLKFNTVRGMDMAKDFARHHHAMGLDVASDLTRWANGHCNFAVWRRLHIAHNPAVNANTV